MLLVFAHVFELHFVSFVSCPHTRRGIQRDCLLDRAKKKNKKSTICKTTSNQPTNKHKKNTLTDCTQTQKIPLPSKKKHRLTKSDAKVDRQRGYAKTAANLKLPNNLYPKSPQDYYSARLLSHSGGYQRPIQEEIKIFSSRTTPAPALNSNPTTTTIELLSEPKCLEPKGYGDHCSFDTNNHDPYSKCQRSCKQIPCLAIFFLTPAYQSKRL